MPARDHAQERLWTFIQDRPRKRQRPGPIKLSELDPLGHDPRHDPAHQGGLGIRPFRTVRIRKETDLLAGGNHLQPFAHDLGNRVRKEIVPPEARQAQVGQFPRQRAHRLVGMAAG